MSRKCQLAYCYEVFARLLIFYQNLSFDVFTEKNGKKKKLEADMILGLRTQSIPVLTAWDDFSIGNKESKPYSADL